MKAGHPRKVITPLIYIRLAFLTCPGIRVSKTDALDHPSKHQAFQIVCRTQGSTTNRTAQTADTETPLLLTGGEPGGPAAGGAGRKREEGHRVRDVLMFVTGAGGRGGLMLAGESPVDAALLSCLTAGLVLSLSVMDEHPATGPPRSPPSLRERTFL